MRAMWQMRERNGGGGTSKGLDMLHAEPDATEQRESVFCARAPDLRKRCEQIKRCLDVIE